MVKQHEFLHLATLKSDVVAIGERVELTEGTDGPVRSVKLCSQKTKTWSHQFVQIDKKTWNGIISFMCRLYLIEGCIK